MPRKTGYRSWSSYTEKLLQELVKYWNEQTTIESKEEWDGLVRERIHRREEDMWMLRARNKPKLRTYIRIKEKFCMEGYLKTEDAVGKRMLTRISEGHIACE